MPVTTATPATAMAQSTHDRGAGGRAGRVFAARVDAGAESEFGHGVPLSELSECSAHPSQ